MNKLKEVSRMVFVNLSYPVKVGEVLGDFRLSLSCYETTSGDTAFDIDDWDLDNIYYMGMEVDGYKGWNKLKEFHKGMGIDLDKLIHEEAKKVVTPEELDIWVKENIKIK